MIKLSKDLKTGDTLEVQLSPFGEFKNTTEDANGKPVEITQVCDREAFDAVVANFTGEVLMDADHESETGGSTRAVAWVQSVRVDASLGLMGTIKVTEEGARLLNGREYRFLSPAFNMQDPFAPTSRPASLSSVALTNKPNLPVRPVLNRAPVINQQPGAHGVPAPPTKGATMLELIIAALGLPADTDEAAAVEAVKQLKAAADTAAAATLNAEAEAAADAQGANLANRAAFVEAYKKNPESAKAVLNAFTRPANTPPPVTNAATAKRPPSFASRTPATAHDTWAAMPEGKAKDDYFFANVTAINDSAPTA